jgi:hypothetical protein
MIRSIDITKSEYRELPFLDEAAYQNRFQKGWSLSSVYNFSEIRDVYLALKQWGNEKFELNAFFSYCLNINIPYVKTEWNKRRLLEHVNALKNFSLIDSNEQIHTDTFENSTIGSELTAEDLSVFRNIYFQYFRFKEIFNWFGGNPIANNSFDSISCLKENDILEKSVPIYSFSNKSRFTDSFIYELKNDTPVYYVDKLNEDLMRFWDVFIKWGTSLKVLEKFSLRNLEIKTINDKHISCVYVVNNLHTNLNLIEFIKENFSGNYIYVPELVFQIATSFRLSIAMVQKFIIEQYKIHKEYLSFERTSEIFIKKQDIREGDKILFPKYNDSYISHLIVRK